MENQDYEYSTTSGYSHNTYHGPTKHYRPLLTGSQLINLQNDEQRPLRFTDSPQHHPPNPSPRRKSSSTSTDELHPPFDRTAIYIPGDYQNNDPCPTCLIRGGEPHYDYGGYSSEYSGYGYGTDYAYDNPSSSSGSRTPQRLPCHRRTPSNLSNSSGSGFRLDEESHAPYGRRQVDYENTARQNSHESASFERPTTLETSGFTKLRSSLKRNNYQQTNSGGNTPTNPTPPDSLTSDDSSYVSASNSSVSRVRFSPTTFADLGMGNHESRRTRPRPSITDREFLS